MKLILISDNGSHHRKINLNRFSMVALFFILSALILLKFTTFSHSNKTILSKNDIQLLNKFDSILIKTANLEGQVKRLNSLGKIIASKGNIDINDYLLSQAPAMGGVDSSSASVITQASLAKSIEDLELELELEEQRYEIMKVVQSKSKQTYNRSLGKPVFLCI